VSSIIKEGANTIVSSDNSLMISASSNAIPKGSTVTIEVVEADNVIGALGKVYRLQTEVNEFDEPVILTFHYDDEMLGDLSPNTLSAAYLKDGSTTWRIATDVEVNLELKTVSVTTNHFSDWIIVASDAFINLTVGDDEIFTYGSLFINPDSAVNAISDSYSIDLLNDTYANDDDKPGFLVEVDTLYDASLYVYEFSANSLKYQTGEGATLTMSYQSYGENPGDIVAGTFTGQVNDRDSETVRNISGNFFVTVE
jgi:hypothetical protein